MEKQQTEEMKKVKLGKIGSNISIKVLE